MVGFSFSRTKGLLLILFPFFSGFGLLSIFPEVDPEDDEANGLPRGTEGMEDEAMVGEVGELSRLNGPPPPKTETL